MPIKILVCIKQVIDSNIPSSAYVLDDSSLSIVPPQGVPPIINGFDEIAVEAALQIRENIDASITVVSIGDQFVMDVIKKPLSMGADELVLVQDEKFTDLDSFNTVFVLKNLIDFLGGFDLVLCGRQASDWDNATVPLGLAEVLEFPIITLAQKIEIQDGRLFVQRTTNDGYEVVESSLPAVITITNEFGEARYPTLMGIMAASRKAPLILNASEIGFEIRESSIKVKRLFFPARSEKCEMIVGEDLADAALLMVLRLREENII